ncbi:aspartyl-tRNA(Asn)/glutamyl-tRNA(Gln) amidotransferase subunit A [Nocardia kruczakiae]|uniref:Aspartyl-tRNA(Asn)/glutamyl-tRNA(Gln) amidotransferase subunit A n=1 Tax=Nocardia kruczakiae TaxID=261477 RepID=A0ABU1XD11_9NOCA|nr:amidase [Nocardia kruczakiae]MDR7168433.1 aspartyl-tRNA(Asn)/glutamyl-tRNA(Gln) amidotransferase subunit A [Nocardia kruczakiae]
MHTASSRRALFRAAGLGLAAAAVARRAPVAGARTVSRHAPLPNPSDIATTDPALLTATEASALLQTGRLHPAELLDACLRRSASYDGATTAWVRTYPELAHRQAERAAQRLAAGNAPLICGLPIAVKDIYAAAGLPVTASSRVLDGNVAAGDATIWRRLREAGAVLIGHVHTAEFAMATDTPQVGNPWDISESIGGSSGGSAAALAARFAPLSIGSDTGGSIRIPASRAGVTAIKPTFGRCSRYGLIPVMWTRDHPSPMGHSVADASLLLSAMVGPDPNDPVTGVAPAPPADGFPLTATGGVTPLSGKRFGVPTEFVHPLPPALGTLFTRFLGLVTALGGETVEVTMPTPPLALATGDAVELGMFHRQWSDRLSLYRTESAAVVAMGLAALAAPASDYWQLERDRARFQRRYNQLLADNRLDAVILPGAITDSSKRDDIGPISLIGPCDIPMMWANYTGTPVLALPAGRSAATGLPFGVQLGGKPWAEADLIAIGLELQAADTAWRDMPSLLPNPRTLPEIAPVTPGDGPDPTNTDAGAPAFNFIPTTSVVDT